MGAAIFFRNSLDRIALVVIACGGFGCLLPTACKDKTPLDSVTAVNVAESVAASPTSRAQSGDTTVPSTSATTGVSAQLVDLVHQTTTLIVSSSHRDAMSRVEFLVDDLAQSAWRPNPPDPHPWVELQFAQEVFVESVALEPTAEATIGADLEVRSPELGLLKLENGVFIFKTPTPQSLTRLRLTVTSHATSGATTRKRRGGVAMAELRVWGWVGPQFLRDYALPEGRAHRNGPYTSVNDPKFRAWWRAAPYGDPEQMCAAYAHTMGIPSESDPIASCWLPNEDVPVSGAKPTGVRGVRAGRIALAPFDDNPDSPSAGLLFIQTDAGWFPANLWGSHDARDGTCPGMHVLRATVERRFWEGNVIAEERSRIYFPPTLTSPSPFDPDAGSAAKETPPLAVKSVTRCELAQPLFCREHVLAYGEPDVVQNDEYINPTPFPPRVWKWERSYRVAENGWLRFSPCRKTRDRNVAVAPNEPQVPCFAPDESSLP